MVVPAARSHPPATYQDILDAPPHQVAEIVDGELHLSPRPAVRHASAGSVLGMDIGGAFQRGRGGPGGWWILDEPELHFDDHVLVPDVAGWRKERLPELPPSAFITLAPDWVCEVVSPSTARWDRVNKVPIYARYGVEWVWLVDPVARTLEVLRLEGERYLLLETFGGDAGVRAAPFDAIELELGALWIGPDETTPAP
ncbi:MAG TPA: Uma2 family endonuclease [Polyangiaceae bacterium]|nr:Uma2 family endonuclease [Polyangiaceae bacterium]